MSLERATQGSISVHTIKPQFPNYLTSYQIKPYLEFIHKTRIQC